MKRYVVTPCSCGRRMGVNGNDIHRVRAQRSGRPDLAAALGSVARSRDEGAQTGVPERHHGSVAASPEVVMPPVRSRQRLARPPSGLIAGGTTP